MKPIRDRSLELRVVGMDRTRVAGDSVIFARQLQQQFLRLPVRGPRGLDAAKARTPFRVGHRHTDTTRPQGMAAITPISLVAKVERAGCGVRPAADPTDYPSCSASTFASAARRTRWRRFAAPNSAA